MASVAALSVVRFHGLGSLQLDMAVNTVSIVLALASLEVVVHAVAGSASQSLLATGMYYSRFFQASVQHHPRFDVTSIFLTITTVVLITNYMTDVRPFYREWSTVATLVPWEHTRIEGAGISGMPTPAEGFSKLSNFWCDGFYRDGCTHCAMMDPPGHTTLVSVGYSVIRDYSRFAEWDTFLPVNGEDYWQGRGKKLTQSRGKGMCMNDRWKIPYTHRKWKILGWLDWIPERQDAVDAKLSKAGNLTGYRKAPIREAQELGTINATECARIIGRELSMGIEMCMTMVYQRCGKLDMHDQGPYACTLDKGTIQIVEVANLLLLPGGDIILKELEGILAVFNDRNLSRAVATWMLSAAAVHTASEYIWKAYRTRAFSAEVTMSLVVVFYALSL